MTMTKAAAVVITNGIEDCKTASIVEDLNTGDIAENITRSTR